MNSPTQQMDSNGEPTINVTLPSSFLRGRMITQVHRLRLSKQITATTGSLPARLPPPLQEPGVTPLLHQAGLGARKVVTLSSNLSSRKKFRKVINFQYDFFFFFAELPL